MTADAQQPASPPPANRPARSSGWRLGSVAGVPVYLTPSWLLLAAVVVLWYGPAAPNVLPRFGAAGGYVLAVCFVLCLLLSVLLHEAGHAIMARRYGIGVRGITLELLGGYTEMEGDSPHPRADLLVSLIGPIVSGVLGLAAVGLRTVLPEGGLTDQLAFQLAWSNIIVAVFNALPGLPLDGGRALRAVVWAVTGNRDTGTTAAGWIGRVVAVGTLAAFLLLAFTRSINVFSLVFAAMVSLVLWRGASAAIAYGRLAKRLPKLSLRQLAKPIIRVPTGTPLSEAARQAAERAPGMVDAAVAVIDSSGRVVALVHNEAAAAVPADRRPWVPVDSVARTLDPGRTLPADLPGTDVIRAIQANPAPAYLVVSGDEVVGVLHTADLARELQS